MGLWVLLLLFQIVRTAQTQDQSASDHIKYLTNQTDRPEVVAVSCGLFATMDVENRAAAQSLVQLGAAALPDIDAVFDSIQKSGNSSKFAPNADWLFYAGAEIKCAAIPISGSWTLPWTPLLRCRSISRHTSAPGVSLYLKTPAGGRRREKLSIS